MDTARCKAFIAAAETGRFTKAAEILNYTTSGVSQLVTALEAELDLSLFVRTRKGVRLTQAGERLLPVARALMQQEQNLYQVSKEIKGLDVGEITIAAYSSISTHWLPAIIKKFKEDYPNIQIRLMEGIRQEVMVWLDDAKADIAFLSSGSDLATYDWTPLAKDRMLAVLSTNHPLAKANSYPISRCASEDFIMPALGRDDDVADLFERFQIEPRILFSTLENYATISMIENDLGMSIMNELITKNFQANVVMLPLEPPQDITLGMAMPSRTSASPAVKKFADYVLKYHRSDNE
ncbi:LysR family transcriptional regulator [Streptococcus equinus]|uniref:LysR family transcriptional regulator n=1 Tax=Streptococcus equinus TaxID=1335 RepID=UPI003BF7DFC9